MFNWLKSCSTPCGITDYLTAWADSYAISQLACSTPCGITDYLTMPLCPQVGYSHVLNALRHH